MVTIEQKLTLFSKLLNQDIKEEMDEKFIQLEREYEKRMTESKFDTDKEAIEIVEQATRRAEAKKTELISRARLSSKKEMMQVKEEMVEKFMVALREKAAHFVETPAYLTYLEGMINQLDELKNYKKALVVYVTKQDYEQHQQFIKSQLVKLGLDEAKLKMEIATTSILGGLILVDTEDNTRIDMSMSETIAEAKEKIIDKISIAIGEVGEVVHD